LGSRGISIIKRIELIVKRKATSIAWLSSAFNRVFLLSAKLLGVLNLKSL
jgi:hypothetical protein